jgi:predicted DNA binding CopG/RHH family protein
VSEAAKKSTERERGMPTQERIEELADFYDRTDTADLAEPGEDITDEVKIEGPEEMEQVSIRLPKEDLEQIRRRARSAGVGHTTMIRMIVHAHLENPLTY